MNENPEQLLEDFRESIPMKPGSPKKYDYEYKINGKANIFLAVKPKEWIRVVKVTERRTKEEFFQRGMFFNHSNTIWSHTQLYYAKKYKK